WGVKLQFRLRYLVRFRLRRLVGHNPFLKSRCGSVSVAAFSANLNQSKQQTRAVPSPLGGKGCNEYAVLVQQSQSVRSRLKTSAPALDAAQPPAVWAWGIKPSRWPSFLAALRARRMASAFSRSCARMVFHTPCDASSLEKRPRVASSS